MRQARGRGRKQLLPVVCARHHMLLVDELDAVDGAPEKGAVRGMAQPHPQPMLPPTLGTAGLLVAIEDKLGLLWDLPHTHGPVPAPGGHTALPAQSI